MSKIQLILLGHFECLLSSGQRISLSMRKAEVLLAYLALTPGLRHPRERLINLLWSDRSDEQARNSLRQCLSAIKKSLGSAADLILLVDRTTVSLKPELIDVDVHEFERLALEGDYESLATAAGLYQGEFLEGISIRDPASQEWLDSERSRFKRQFIETLSNLAETQLISHDYNHAIRSAERLVEQDPLGESGWRLLMRSYAESGDRSHALQAFKRCQQNLRDELDVEPEVITIELRDQIAAGESRPSAKPVSAAKPDTIPDAPGTAASASTDHSIAVLPFDNLSGDPEQEYFTDGITDSIILHLSLFPGLNVKSRNSSFAFKQQIKSLGEISQELEVDYIVEGSIRKTEDRIRITVQLIEAASGNQVWGKRYDAEIENLFDLEEELSRTIATTVTGQIESDLQRIAIAKGAVHQKAYDLLLQGIYHSKLSTPQDCAIAIEKLNQCLALDASNALAHATLYGCHEMNWIDRWVSDFEASRKLCKVHASKALELNPDLGQVQVAYAEYLIFSRDYDEAEAHLKKALGINPNDSEAIAALALNLSSQGKFEAALEQARLAIRLDPYHTWVRWILTEAQFFCGQYEEALTTIAETGNPPGFLQIHKIAANIRLNRMDVAQETLKIFLQNCRNSMLSMPRNIDEWLAYSRDNSPFADSAINQEIVDYLVQAGLEDSLSPTTSPDKSDQHSIAVLPFDNLSGDAEQEYFSDGITDSIILNLSAFPRLNVKSRNASFAFKQQIKNLGEISEELKVDYLVEGSIRKSADQVRINVQLIEATSGNQVWGKRYDAVIENLFELEAELSRTIAATVTGQIESDLQRIAIAKGASNQTAYDLLLSGNYHCNKMTRGDMAISIEKLNRCLELDPDNHRAWSGLYDCHMMNAVERWYPDHEASFKQAGICAQKALALAPDNTHALSSIAEFLTFSRKPQEALEHIKKALQHNPNDAVALCEKSFALCMMGQYSEALKYAELAFNLDPYFTWAAWNLSESQILSGRYEEALQTAANAKHDPELLDIYSIVAYVKLGRLEPARQTLKRYIENCHRNMVSMPKSRAEWLDYSKTHTPLLDTNLNEDIVECLMKAGLEEELTKIMPAESPDQQPGILVLPFNNMSGDPEQEYFSDGITESIILTLSSSWGLTVKSRHTSFAYQNSTQSIREIGDELDVPYVVEGSIRKHQDQVRITVQLGESSTGNQIWGKRYDKPLDELFEVEEDLVRSIAGAISGRIGREVRIIASKKPASDMKSFDYLMRGWHYYEQHNPEAVAKSIECHKKCIEIDPENVDAHAFIAGVSTELLYENWSEDREQTKSEIEHYFQKALALDQNNAFTHALMSDFINFSGDYEKGLYHADRAIELDPTLPDGYSIKAINLIASGDIYQAVKLADFSMQLDQFHNYTGWGAGEVYRCAGDYKKAIEAFSTISNMPPSLHAQTAACLVGLGQLDKAKAEITEYLRKAREFMPRLPASQEAWRSLWSENLNYQGEKDFDVFFEQLLQAGLCDDLDEATDRIPSIAVLPFENMSGDPDQEYFSDGITSSLILGLGLFKGLNVKSQNSSFSFKGSASSSQDIAEELNADYLIEGSIRKSGSKVRLAVQLVESKTDSQIWGKQYDAELEDILELEQELSQTIAATISGRIGNRIQQAAARKPAKDLKSYDYLLRGLYHLGRFTAVDMEIARQQLEKCLDIDPENAEAHINLAMAHSLDIYENWSRDISVSKTLIRQHNQQALKFAPENALVHAYLAEEYLNFIRDYDQAEFHADRAIELNPTAVEGYTVKADIMSFTRRYDQALVLADQCLQLDPHSVGAGWVAGSVYMFTRDFEKSIRTYRSISNPPASIHALTAASLIGHGQTDQAKTEMQLFKNLAREQMPRYPESVEAWRKYWHQREPFKFEDDFEHIFQLLVRAGLCDDIVVASDDIPSIAVLPFENMSGDPEQEYFSDGITTDIIATLSRFDHMRTVSRFSVLQYKNQHASIPDIAQQQNVRYILEGSVRKSGNSIRVSAELIDSQDEKICWSERYDRDLDDLFAVQDEITKNIALAMKVQLDDGDMALHRSTGTSNIKAWQLTLAAIDLQDTYIRENILEARRMAQQAINLDPDYPYAWVALGWTFWQEVYSGWSNSPEDSLVEAEKAQQKALDLVPLYSEAWTLGGLIHLMRHKPTQALEYCRKAVELEPGNAEIQALMAFCLIYVGDYENARQHEQTMLKLCPVLPNWYYLLGGEIEQIQGNYETAAHCYQQGIDVEPDSPLCRFYLIDVMMEQGNETRAGELADEIKALDKQVKGRGLVRTLSQDKTLRERFRANLEKFDLY